MPSNDNVKFKSCFSKNLFFVGNISSPVVAFSAYLSGSITPIALNEAFVYGSVTLNEGGAYNVHVGRFRAPVAGIYHFVATAQSKSSDNLEFELVRDGILLCRGRGTQSTGTCATTVHLSANNDVWVRHYSNNGNMVYGSAYAVFTGHIVHAD